ncbi:MAG: sulfatase-like hydrolase/transferase, partial [Verrucomicrobiales bacterium]|nr:sulfatase-like hydrolase/transferase [Verrucomicrobiales bacterium]
FFLWYAPFLPHTPHNPPQRLFDKYKDQVDSPHVARYYAMCEWFDETCGELIDHLDKAGIADNTLIVYICDNGWIQNPNKGGYDARSKQTPYEGGVRQPTMFCWPGKIKPGDRGNQLCSSVDIVPTMLAAAGLEKTEAMPGYNLLPILKSGDPSPRKIVFGEGCAHDIADIENPEETLLYRWAIEGKWKLLLTYDGVVNRYQSTHPRTEKRPQLFNLLDDPHEENNVAKDNPEVVARLAKEIADWYPVTERKVITAWTD